MSARRQTDKLGKILCFENRFSYFHYDIESKLIVARTLKIYNTYKYTINENVTNVNMRSGLVCKAQCSFDGKFTYI